MENSEKYFKYDKKNSTNTWILTPLYDALEEYAADKGKPLPVLRNMAIYEFLKSRGIKVDLSKVKE